MNIPYILQIIIVLLVFAMFCLAMFCISRSTVDADTHESFATTQDSHDTTVAQSPSTTPTETIANTPVATGTTTEEEPQWTTEKKKENEEPSFPTNSQTSSESAKSFENNEKHYGYTIRDPSTWGMPQRHAPVCMPKSHPEIRPVYTDGVPMYALEVQTHKKNTK